ncbi:MAG TPA: mycofactocin biosynthesis glycosyltransferase MftF [Acidimicrobiia bacterium]|nr:mycofactocin biosynthesis glycosyltransferase MftF [Acidimicrobiia bacterium]
MTTTTAAPLGGLLPDGFRVALDPDARWAGDGSVLVGGAPIRLLRLTPAGRALVDRLAAGEPVPRAPGAQRLTRRLLDAGLAHPRPPFQVSSAEVAVVIPVHNDAEGLAATLTALPDSAAIVVVDDASTDAEAVPVGGTRPGTTLLRRTVRGGPAAARNDGWRATGAPFVAFVDANCEPEPGWLDVLLPHFADPQVAAVAPRILPPPDTGNGGALAAYEAVASPLDLGAKEAAVRPGSRVAYVPTAALVVRRSALEELGGFDETLRVGEDVDFVWRLVAAGWSVRYEPRAVVRHPRRSSWSAWLQQRYRYGTSAAPLARRHGWAVAPAVMSPWTAGAWALVAAGQPLLGAVTAGSSVAALSRQVPQEEALRLAGHGHLRGGLALARALRRAWAPAAVLLVVTGRRNRAAVAAVVAVPGLVDWLRRRPRLDPARFAALRLADDLAYAGGVWAGCARERSARALLPDLRSASRRRARQTYDPVSASIGGDR